ncbi:hypothetical protein NQ317_012216 [Molorchus minor]|uniref:Uncharacterized protein n=1 Tax=Molorchus minor TaxID=1323400 RepID=A0ABQ9IRU9_9CUCU|nr:hypothetical protein NQ317_012216 [Molorchus minor]
MTVDPRGPQDPLHEHSSGFSGFREAIHIRPPSSQLQKKLTSRSTARVEKSEPTIHREMLRDCVVHAYRTAVVEDLYDRPDERAQLHRQTGIGVHSHLESHG